MVFKNWSYRKRNRFLLPAIPVVAIILWFGVLSRTFDLYSENLNMKKVMARADEAPQRLAKVSASLQTLNARFEAYSLDSLKDREYLLQVVSNFCRKNNIILKEFPQKATEVNKDYGLETNLVVAEGEFKDLLRLLYELEQKSKIGRPTSVRFEKTFDHKRRKAVLTLTIYLQNIKLSENENSV